MQQDGLHLAGVRPGQTKIGEEHDHRATMARGRAPDKRGCGADETGFVPPGYSPPSGYRHYSASKGGRFYPDRRVGDRKCQHLLCRRRTRGCEWRWFLQILRGLVSFGSSGERYWGNHEKTGSGCGLARHLRAIGLGCGSLLLADRDRGGRSDPLCDRSDGRQLRLPRHNVCRIPASQPRPDRQLSEGADHAFPRRRRLRQVEHVARECVVAKAGGFDDWASLPAAGDHAEAGEHARRQGVPRLCPAAGSQCGHALRQMRQIAGLIQSSPGSPRPPAAR